VVLATVVGATCLAYLATPTYRVTVKMMPRQADVPTSGLGSLMGQLGGLASLAGIGLGGSVDEQEAVAWLKSRALFETFSKQEGLMPLLFRKEWDSARHGWRADLERQPTADDAWAYFDRKIRVVDEDMKTRLITLQISWRDREQAAAWANELVHLANEELRQRALREAESSLKSLQEQLAQTDTVELRNSIYQLMQAQVSRKVMAKSRPEYALAVLDPAVVPDADHFASPKRKLMIFASIPIGMLLGCCLVLALNWIGRLWSYRQVAATDCS
jgi:capsular polysaccharide biosynthesis protein